MTLLATNGVLTLHQGFSRVILIYAAILAVWGIILYLLGRNPPGGYLGALIILEGVAILQGLIGAVLYAQGHRPHEQLHLIYGVVIVLTLPVAYLMSETYDGNTRNASLVFGIGALVLLGAAIRAITTGQG